MEERSMVMVAMKGHPGTGKSTLAHAIAAELRCPLLAKDHVRGPSSSLQSALSSSSSSSSAAGLLNNFSYDVVFELAAAQLGLGLSVVLDSPLSRASHLHRLLALSSSSGARLLIIECRPSDGAEWRRRVENRAGDGDSWHKPRTWRDLEALLEGYGGRTDYDLCGVPRLVVDTTAAAAAGGFEEELVSGVMEFIAEHCARPPQSGPINARWA